MLRLSDSEWAVLEALWHTGPVPLSTLVEELRRRGSAWAPNTVHTLLTRLSRKGAVAVHGGARPFRYEAAVDRRSCEGARSADLLSRVFGGSRPGLHADGQRAGLR